ncbi:hypothetical protein GCM10027170_18230 [Aliiglaciecola aliphaticivorans]
MVSFACAGYMLFSCRLFEGTSRLSNFYEFLAEQPDKIPTLKVEINVHDKRIIQFFRCLAITGNKVK